MIQVASRKSYNKKIVFLEADVLAVLPFARSFDVVIASFVAEKKQMLKEMKRIGKQQIILNDYNQQRGLLTGIFEWLEHGDYFNFIESIHDELHEMFDHVEIVPVNQHSDLYIMRI